MTVINGPAQLGEVNTPRSADTAGKRLMYDGFAIGALAYDVTGLAGILAGSAARTPLPPVYYDDTPSKQRRVIL